MKHHPLAMEAILHAQMASLLAELFWSRLKCPAESGDSAQVFSPQVERAFTQMKLYSHQPWQVEELARLAGMSPPNFFRRFKQATGSSPIDWLRRERISQAKRHLIETADAVADIADRVGYSDPFYFSRDFKRMTGRTPSEYRRHERHQS
jgi:AraC-like DNA-binding protein